MDDGGAGHACVAGHVSAADGHCMRMTDDGVRRLQDGGHTHRRRMLPSTGVTGSWERKTARCSTARAPPLPSHPSTTSSPDSLLLSTCATPPLADLHHGGSGHVRAPSTIAQRRPAAARTTHTQAQENTTDIADDNSGAAQVSEDSHIQTRRRVCREQTAQKTMTQRGACGPYPSPLPLPLPLPPHPSPPPIPPHTLHSNDDGDHQRLRTIATHSSSTGEGREGQKAVVGRTAAGAEQ